MSTALYVNDYPLDSAGFDVTQLPRWLDDYAEQFAVAQLAGRLGGILGQSVVPPRTLRIAGYLSADTVAERDANLTALLARFDGLVEVRTSDAPDKVLEAVLIAHSATGAGGPSFVEPDLLVTLDLLCPTPLKEDRLAQSVAFGATRTAVPTGTAPHGGTLRIMGATDPTVTYRAASGEAVATMGFTVTLASDEYLDVALDRQTITKYDSGVSSNALSAWTAGDFLAVSPEDGDIVNEVYPTLEIDSGSALLLYRRRWVS